MNADVLVELKFPKERLKLYNRLLTLFSKYGEESLLDCKATCSTKNKNVVTCWNMFTAATAAYNLGEVNKADVIYNYIEGQLQNIYKDTDVYPENEISYYNYISTITDEEDPQSIVTDDNLYDFVLKGHIVEVQFKENSRLTIITELDDLGVLDYSVEHPLTRDNITIGDKDYYIYQSQNTYNTSTRRIKFITKHYE